MHIRTGLVAGLLVVGLLGATGPAFGQDDLIEPITVTASHEDPLVQDDENATDPYQKLPAGIVETIGMLSDDACQKGLEVLNSQGWHAPTNSQHGYEYDLMSEGCAEFRDTLEHRFLNGQDAPFVQHCNYIYGVTCVAVGHYACDFAIMVRSGLVYYCLGGLTPYN